MDDAEIETLTEKPAPVTKRNWILLSVDDELDKIVSDYPSADKLKLALSELPKNVNIGSKFDGINSLNDYIVDYYRRRFGGDLTSRPMSSPTNNSPHSFRRFSSTSIDQLTLKSKFQALQWKFRHQPPLTVITSGGPIRATPAPASVAATTSSASPSFRRKAGRLVDESFGFIDSELQKPRKKFIVNHNRPLHRTEMEIQLPHRRETESKKMTTSFQSKFNKNRAQTRTNNHLVEYSSNDGEIYAVYAKRDQNRADANTNSSRNRNVQFDDQIRVVERYHPDMQISTGGFVRQLCAIVKPHKRDKEYFNSSKLNIISAYSPSINVPKPNSSSGDLESSFYSAGKSCTLPSLPVDGTTSPVDMDMMTSSMGRDIYSADVDQASITENPAFRDEFQFNANGNSLAASGSRQLGSSQVQGKNDEIFVTHESDLATSKRKLDFDNRSQHSTTKYEPLKSKSFIIAICTVVLLIIMTAIGVGFTIYYD